MGNHDNLSLGLYQGINQTMKIHGVFISQLTN